MFRPSGKALHPVKIHRAATKSRRRVMQPSSQRTTGLRNSHGFFSDKCKIKRREPVTYQKICSGSAASQWKAASSKDSQRGNKISSASRAAIVDTIGLRNSHGFFSTKSKIKRREPVTHQKICSGSAASQWKAARAARPFEANSISKLSK